MTNIEERANDLAEHTMDRIQAYSRHGMTPYHAQWEIIQEEFEKELEIHAAFRRKVDTMLSSLQEDFKQLGYPIEAGILAFFRDGIEE